MVKARWWRRAVLANCAVLATLAVGGTSEGANCGDTAGPFLSRVPCACGDTVVTNTRLRPTDPVVTTACTLADIALAIGRDNLTLDCRGLTLIGDDTGSDIAIAAAVRGIYSERSGVTVQNCTVQFFIDGIELLGNRNRVLYNVALDTFGGIVIAGDDNRIENNRSERAFAEGIVVLGGRRNLVNRNQMTDNFDGLVYSGERGLITLNTASHNDRTGIDVDGNNNYLLSNVANRNGDGEGPQSGDGFLVEGVGNILIGNQANDNEAHGFCVVPGNAGALNTAVGNDQAPQIDFNCTIAAVLRTRRSD